MTSSTADPTPAEEAPVASRATRQDRQVSLPSGAQVAEFLRTVRERIGAVAGLVCTIAAVVLLLGAVLVVVGANEDNALVTFVLQAADAADLGVFSRTDGIKQFTGEGAAMQNAIVNWGLGAAAWLVAGRLLRRLLAP